MGVKAILMHKGDKLGSGETIFTNTGVEYADDGIKGLLDNVPQSQQDWIVDGPAPLTYPYDATTGRLPAHLAAPGAGNTFLRKRLLLPRNFGVFPDSSLKVITRRHGTNGGYTLTLVGPGAIPDPDVDGVDINPVSADEYEQFIMTPGGFYTPNDPVFVTIEVQFTGVGGEWVEICDLEFTTRSGRGNI